MTSHPRAPHSLDHQAAPDSVTLVRVLWRGATVMQRVALPLAAEAISARRYAITEMAATLADERGEGVPIAAGAALHIALADFSLRAAGRWSARGKAIPRALAAMDPTLVYCI